MPIIKLGRTVPVLAKVIHDIINLGRRKIRCKVARGKTDEEAHQKF